MNRWCIIEQTIWIPRFAYNKNDNTKIKFIKGNSNIATDNTYIDLQDWVIPSIFTQENEELTGKWISESLIEQYLAKEYYNIRNLEKDIQKIQYILAYNDLSGAHENEGTSHFETVVFNERGEIEFNGSENSYLIPTRRR